MQHDSRTKGFGLVGVLIIIVVLAVVGGTSVDVYHRDHKAKNSTTNSGSSSKSSTQTNKTTKPSTNDAYAGWKSYCDSTYHYCFKYPSDWTNNYGELLSPSKTVQVNYQNPDNRDGGPISFLPSYIQKLSAANQDLTVVGGYYPTDGYVSLYTIVDSSLLTTYPLKVGAQSQFVNNPIFIDAGASVTTYGAIMAKPDTSSINSAADAQAWLNSPDAKTSLLILQSFYYQQ